MINSHSDNQKKDTILSFFAIGYFFIQALNLLVKYIIGDSVSWSLISKAPLLVLLILSLLILLKRKPLFLLASESIAALLFASTFLRGFATFAEYKNIFVNLLFVYIPIGLSVSAIKDKKTFLKWLYIFSWPIHLIVIYTLIKAGTGAWTYSMSLGYSLAFQTLIMWEHYFETKKPLDIIMVVVDIIFILVFTSRGPLLCLLVFLIIELIFSNKINSRKKLVHIVSLLFVSIVLILSMQSVMNLLANISSQFAHYSRTIDKLISGDFLSDSGRFELTQHYLSMISSNWIIGYGVGGAWVSVSYYPHNIVIEFLLSYGIILGVFMIALLGILVLSGLLSKNHNMQRLFILIVSFCVYLLVSDSYLMSPHFFILLFAAIDYMLNKRKHKADQFLKNCDTVAISRIYFI